MPMWDRSRQRRFWELIRGGCSRQQAAAELGLGMRTGRRWFLQAGGVVPAYVRATRSNRYLSLAEREEIFAGVVRGDAIRAIAKSIHRAPSTVLRELRRNMRHQYRTRSRLQGVGGRPRTLPWDYRPSQAQQRAERLAARPKPSKLAMCPQLRSLVQHKLEEKLSPGQIAFELREEYPNQREMWVSPETIYQAIYVQGRGALRRDLAHALRTGRAVRKPRPGRSTPAPHSGHGEH